jgi:cobyrinic acid a,c-diamide synthase
LAAAGAELVPFSPLADPDLPKNLKGLYIGGGYPELFAETLAENRGLTAQIRAMGRAGAPIYGECGGLMYLGRSIKDLEGRRWEMTGLLPLDTAMLPRLKALGYREVRLTGDALLGPAGARIRGHEFHYSEITASDSMKRVYEATDRAGNVEAVQGYMQDNILAGYVHLHFGSRPEAAERFVDACRKGPLP